MELIQFHLPDLLARYGPWLLAVLAFLETSFVTGLAVPSGLATSMAVVLAVQGVMSLPLAVVGAAVGGWLGDVSGFWIGRAVGERILTGDGRFARATARRNRRWSRLLGREALYSVTLARVVSFLRSIMPMAAGMSGLPFRRFLLYEAPGLLAWLGVYVALGLVAGESWEAVTRIVGVGGAVMFVAAGALFWVLLRRIDPAGGRRLEGEEGSC